MKLGPKAYVPSLRWRQGEYQALSRLSDPAKDRVVPFITIPEVEFDFELWVPKKTVHEHVHPFAQRYYKKWGMRPAWIDAHLEIQNEAMDDGKLPITYVFNALRVVGSSAVPVLSLDSTSATRAAVAGIVAIDGRGLGVRLRIEHLMKPGCKSSVDALMTDAGVSPNQVDLVVDLGAPNFEPYEDFSDALLTALALLGNISQFRSYVVVGSAFPQPLGIDKPGGDIPRHDWKFYKALIEKISKGDRVPHYGDYTIVNPEFKPMDMRRVKSSGKLVYAESESWCVRKGGAFRDNPAQMHDHCKWVLDAKKFRGSKFSDGDAFIEKVAYKTAKPSNQPFWKQVAISHHIMQVLEDLSKHAGAA